MRIAFVICSLVSIRVSADVRTIDTPNAVLRLDARSGDLVGLDWKKPALGIIAEPRLGESFRLLLPKKGFEAAYFNSRDQTVSRIEPIADGVICHYDSLRRDGEALPVKVRYTIRAIAAQLELSIEVDNPTDR